MKTLPIVVPAYNEADDIPPVPGSLPSDELARLGRDYGTTGVFRPERGYANAYRAGLVAAFEGA